MKRVGVDKLARVVEQHNYHHQPAQDIYRIKTLMYFSLVSDINLRMLKGECRKIVPVNVALKY